MARYPEEFEDENALWPVWRPLVGTIVAMIVVMAVAVASTGRLPSTMAELLGRAFGQSLIAYAALYYFALRRRGAAWKVIGFLLLIGVAVFFNLGRVGMEGARMRDEAHALAGDLSTALDGREVKGEAAANTLSGVFRDLIMKLQADDRAVTAEMEAAGATAMASPDTLRKRPEVLRNCGKLDALAERTPQIQRQWEDRVTEARRSLNAIDADPGFRADAVRGFDQAFERNHGEAEHRFALMGQMLGELGTMCRVLARHHWQGSSVFLFTSPGDLSDYRAAGDRYNAAFHEQEQLASQAETRARTALQGLQRDFK